MAFAPTKFYNTPINNNSQAKQEFSRLTQQLYTTPTSYTAESYNNFIKMHSAIVEPKRTKRYVEEVFRQVEAKPGVEDILILNLSGVPVKMSMDRQEGLQYACLYDNLREKCQAFLSKTANVDRVRTRYNKVLITDAKITILVVQNAPETFLKFKEQGPTLGFRR